MSTRVSSEEAPVYGFRERQNGPEALRLLAAQRVLYSRADGMRQAGFVLIFLLAVGGMVAAVSPREGVSQLIAIVAVAVWCLDTLVERTIERQTREEAAAIQERFDCTLLELPWPDHKGIEWPTDDRVRQLANLLGKSETGVEALRDWYAVPPRAVSRTELRWRCQKANVWWDVTLRRRFRVGVWLVFSVLLAAPIVLAAGFGFTVAKLVAMTAAGLCILTWMVGEIQAQGEAIGRLQRLHRLLSDRETEAAFPDRGRSRQIQDEILEHRRSDPAVPDWLYWLYRPDQEAEMRSSVQ